MEFDGTQVELGGSASAQVTAASLLRNAGLYCDIAAVPRGYDRAGTGVAQDAIGAMQYDLFISHSSADAAMAVAWVDDIETRGIKCWIAPRDIRVGANYQSEIVRGIENSSGILLLFSRSTNESEHVLREVELANESKKPIYPIKVDVSEPSGGLKYMLANTQWVEKQGAGQPAG